MKVSINFIVDKEGDRPDGKLRMRVRWGKDNRVAVNLGYRVDLAKWSTDTQRCKINTLHGPKHVHASEINAGIQRYEKAAETASMQFAEEVSADEFRAALRSCLGREEGKAGKSFMSAWTEYVRAASVEHSWTKSSEYTIMTFGTKIIRECPGLTLEEAVTKDWVIGQIESRNNEGLKNRSTFNWFVRMKAFAHWCAKQGWVDDAELREFNPKLKRAERELVWFTWDRLMILFNAELDGMKSLVRDAVCFSSFTGLRVSDVANLKWSSVTDDAILLYTKKTTTLVRIELNKYSRAILERRRAATNVIWPEYVFGRKALGFAHDINKTIKVICRELGFNEPVTQCYYVGGERKERTEPFCNFVSSHCGRRTFVCNALEMGISPEIVMKWTGHASYDTMKPYIAVSDRAKADAMKKFDRE